MAALALLQMVVLMALSTICKGTTAISMKLAQRGYEANIRRTLFFTWIYMVFQAIFQLVLPPYSPMVFSVEKMILPALFGIFYVLNIIFNVKALNEGPTSLTMVINSFNTLFPIFIGLFIWNETIKATQIIGLCLFVAAMVVFNGSSYSSKESGGQNKKMTPRWLLFTMAGFAFACLAVTCSKQFALLYPNSIKEYLFGYSSIAAVILLPIIIYIFIKHPDDIIKDKKFFTYTAISAISVDTSNIIFMLYISTITAAFYFPLMSILSVFAVTVGSRLVLKERISRSAVIGLCISAVALAILAL